MNKMPMYRFYCEYMQSKYTSKVQLCCIDMDRFVYEKEMQIFYKDSTNDVDTMFDINEYLKMITGPYQLGETKNFRHDKSSIS